jgi:hypothetical protein
VNKQEKEAFLGDILRKIEKISLKNAFYSGHRLLMMLFYQSVHT